MDDEVFFDVVVVFVAAVSVVTNVAEDFLEVDADTAVDFDRVRLCMQLNFRLKGERFLRLRTELSFLLILFQCLIRQLQRTIAKKTILKHTFISLSSDCVPNCPRYLTND